MRTHMARVIPWVGVSGIPGTVYPLWGPNQLSGASELEMHSLLPPSPYAAGESIRDMNQGPRGGFSERTPTDKAPRERFVLNRCLMAGVYWELVQFHDKEQSHEEKLIKITALALMHPSLN